MNWIEIKESISEDLMTRGLSDPNIRLRALDRVELILKKEFPKYLQNPSAEFGKIDKEQFKASIAKYKPKGRLTGAESSVINEIYYRI